MSHNTYTLDEKVDHVVLISKHPHQKCYYDLSKQVKSLTFIEPKQEIQEAEFIKSLNLEAFQHTAVLFDDVSYQLNLP